MSIFKYYPFTIKVFTFLLFASLVSCAKAQSTSLELPLEKPMGFPEECGDLKETKRYKHLVNLSSDRLRFGWGSKYKAD